MSGYPDPAIVAANAKPEQLAVIEAMARGYVTIARCAEPTKRGWAERYSPRLAGRNIGPPDRPEFGYKTRAAARKAGQEFRDHFRRVMACVTGAPTEAPRRRFRVSLDGYADHVVTAQTLAKAKYADWCAAKEAGIFTGRDGFRRYLCAASFLELPKENS